MLRKIPSASLVGVDDRPGLLASLFGMKPSSTLYLYRAFKPYCSFAASETRPGWTATANDLIEHVRAEQTTTPVRLGKMIDGRTIWWYRDDFYTDSDDHGPDDVRVLLDARRIKEQRSVERARSLVDASNSSARSGREPIPDDVKTLVWQRDGGKCVKCHSNRNLEFDHIIPVSMGGSNTARNLQLLCQDCNREKGGNLV